MQSSHFYCPSGEWGEGKGEGKIDLIWFTGPFSGHALIYNKEETILEKHQVNYYFSPSVEFQSNALHACII